jgi:predicted SAM-dependent methyltransferase
MKSSKLLKFFVWEMVNPYLLKRKKNKIYKFDPAGKGINLGCGLDSPPGWTGVDGGFTHYFVKRAPALISKLFFKKFNMSKNYTFKKYRSKLKTLTFIHHNFLYGIPFPDNSVPNIFSSHFLEHLTPQQGNFLLSESYRVLRPGGIIRICVPSLDKVVYEIKEAIADYESGGIEKIQSFVTSPAAGYLSYFSNHRWMYNFRELQAALSKAGFIEIKEVEYKKGNIPDVEILDTRDGLFVEAVKDQGGAF